MAKVGRNQKCPCRSGLKYKHCHGHPNLVNLSSKLPEPFIAALNDTKINNKSGEIIRQEQQGLGRKIISKKIGGYRVVSTGKTMRWSKNWLTFVDFLCDYIKTILGGDWGNSEIAKSIEERHPILQWYHEFSSFQQSVISEDRKVYSAKLNNISACYLGLAYSLYLLEHNVELQQFFVKRLKNVKQFQGAYYELFIANCLIRAGFKLELEDETDQSIKHCEFSATSAKTGKKYWVEAKMRSEPGILGKTDNDGAKSKDPTSMFTKHLNEALKKTASDNRIIFIDLNTTPDIANEQPIWLSQIDRRLKSREIDNNEQQRAYLFVTNINFHRMPANAEPYRELFVHGLGIDDFGKEGEVRLPDWYRSKQRHIDAFEIMEMFKTYPQIPSTFDGRPSSEALENSQRIWVDETYQFEGVEEKGIVGKVTSVAVAETEARAYMSVQDVKTGKGHLLSKELSESELSDWKRYGNAYFGDSKSDKNHELKSVFELFEWLVETYSQSTKKKLLEFVKARPDYELLKKLKKQDLVLEVCEGWAISMDNRKSEE